MQSTGIIVLAVVSLGLAATDMASSRLVAKPVSGKITPEIADLVQTEAKPESATQQAMMQKPQPDTEASTHRSSGFPTVQQCTQIEAKPDRLACYDKIVNHGKPNLGARDTLAIIGNWRINARRLDADTSGRVFIRTANQTSDKDTSKRAKIRHLYAACRQGERSFWLDFGKQLKGQNPNIAVEISFDDAPYRTFFMKASSRQTAIGYWRGTQAQEILGDLRLAKQVRVRAIHDDISHMPARFDTADMNLAMEPLDVACQ